jgi:hypothetical protein
MKTHDSRRSTFSLLAVTIAALMVAGDLAGMGPLLLGGGEAEAVVGHPLTPVSYAGVARRTTRRTAVVTTLPAGCAKVVTSGSVTYTCGTVRYAPYYDGPTVVYRPL